MKVGVLHFNNTCIIPPHIKDNLYGIMSEISNPNDDNNIEMKSGGLWSARNIMAEK